MKLLNLSQHALSHSHMDTMSATAGKTVYICREFLSKNSGSDAAKHQSVRKLIPQNQLEILNFIQNSIFSSFSQLEAIYNIVCADLPELPPLNEQGELDYSSCPRPFLEEMLSLTSKGIVGLIDWDDEFSIQLFANDIKALTCYAYFSVKEESDTQKEHIARIMHKDNIRGLFENISCTPENFKNWAGVLCQGTVAEVFELLSTHNFGICPEQRNFILKAILYLVVTDSMMLCDRSFTNPIYGCMKGYKILPNLKVA